MLTVKILKRYAKEIISLLLHYKKKHWNEQAVLPILYGYLYAKHPGHVFKEQRMIDAPGWKNKRIDLLHKGSNPVAIELAVRPTEGGGSQQLDANNNKDELRKLSRVTRKKAKTSVLLLLDCRKKPKSELALREKYARVTLGPGRFSRRPVRVVYVHRDICFDFLWRP